MSPMLDLQRRHAEVFRLRFGDQRGNNNAPRKLTKEMRVTSHGRDVVEAFTTVYGGTPQEWSSPKGPAWEAYLPITEIPVMVLPGQSITQWWERYKSSVCDRRCDGEVEQLSGEACMCPATIEQRMGDRNACSPMTRVNIICSDVPVLGAGAFVSHGRTAAETLPQAIDIVEGLLERGVRVPAMLRIVEHRGRRHFVVPQIEIAGGVTVRQLMEGTVPAIDANGERRAIESGGVGNDGGEEVNRAVRQPAHPAGSGGTASDDPGTPAHLGASPRPSGPTLEPGMEARHADSPPLPHEIEGADGDPTASDPAAPSLPLPNAIAAACRDAGLAGDDERHAFLEAFSEGRYASSHEVPPAEVNDLRATLVRWKRGELTITAGDDSPILVDRQSGTPDTSPAPLPHGWPAQTGDMDHASWMEAIRDVPGIGQAKLLGKARELANELGQPAPTSLNAVTDPKLVGELQAWLKTQR